MQSISGKTAQILWISGDKAVQKYVFEKYGFGYWTACFDVLCQKWGYLSIEDADQHILEHPALLVAFDLIVISWLPDSFWKPEYLTTLKTISCPVFMEGPFPEKLARYLGLRLDTTIEEFDQAELKICDSELYEYLDSSLKDIQKVFPLSVEKLNPETIPVISKQVFTRPVDQTRADLSFSPDYSTQTRSQNALLSCVFAYQARFARFGYFYPESLNQLLVVYVCLETLAKCKPGNYKLQFSKWLTNIIGNMVNNTNNDKHPNPKSLWALILIRSGDLLELPHVTAKGNLLADEIIHELKPSSSIPLQELLWGTALVGSLKSACPPTLLTRLSINLTSRVFSEGGLSNIPLLWFAVRMVRSYNQPTDSLLALFVEITRKIDGMDDLIRNSEILKLCEGLSLWEIILLSGVFKELKKEQVTLKLIESCLEKCFDHEKGFFQNAQVQKGEWFMSKGFSSGPWTSLALLSIIDQLEISDPTLEFKSYTPEQIAAWSEKPYRLFPFICDDCQTLALLHHERRNSPAIIRKDNFFASTFQLFSYLSFFHTMPPLEEALDDCPSSHIFPLEVLLFCLLEKIVEEKEYPLLRVTPWPFGKQFCLSIRHDVDRLPTKEDFERLLNFETSKKLGVSWYWVAGRTDFSYMQDTLNAGHENGLHAMRLLKKGEEKKGIEKSGNYTFSVVGETWHGGGGGDYWRGHPSVKRACNNGLFYTELAPNILNFPYIGFPVLETDGCINVEKIVGLTHNTSVDKCVRKQKSLMKLDEVKELHHTGYYCMILNHPDINFEDLRRGVLALPESKRIDWNCEQVARWWQFTHNRKFLSIKRVISYRNGYCFSIESKKDICGLCLEFSEIYVTKPFKAFLMNERDQKTVYHQAVNDHGKEKIQFSLDLSAGESYKLIIKSNEPETTHAK